MAQRRRVALVFFALAALLALAWFTRARWLPPLLAGLTDNAALIQTIENLVSIAGAVIPALLALAVWLGLRRPPPAPPNRLVQPITLEALRTQFQDLRDQSFTYIDRGAMDGHTLTPRLAIIGPPKVGKTREAVELIGRVLEPRRILPTRLYQPTTSLRAVDTSAAIGQISKDVPEPGPLLLFLDDLPYHFRGAELERLAEALVALERCGALYVVVTARADQMTTEYDDWLRANGFETIQLDRWAPEAIARLAEDGVARVAPAANAEGHMALVAGSDGTPELTRLTLLELARLGRSDKRTVEDTQRATYLEMWRATRRELMARQPAVEPLLWALAVFYEARVTPYSSLVLALAAQKLKGLWRKRKLRQALSVLQGFVAEETGHLTFLDYVAEAEAIGDRLSSQESLTSFLLSPIEQVKLHLAWFRAEFGPYFSLTGQVGPSSSQFKTMITPREDLIVTLALSLEKQGHLEDATRLLALANSIRPLPRFFIRRAITHAENGRAAEALADYTEAIRLDPTSAMAYLGRGSLYANQGRDAEALADYSEASRLDPTSAVAFLVRGVLYAEQGNQDEALTAYAEAIRIRPGLAPAYKHRALLNYDQGRTTEALADLTEALRLNPSDETAVFMQGVLHTKAGHVTQALAEFTKAIQLNPTEATAFVLRGIIHADQERPAEALADFNEAIRLDPSFAQAFKIRGTIQANQGRMAEALADYNESVRLDPTNAATFYVRGILNVSNGDEASALADFTEAIRLDPSLSNAYYMRGLLLTNHGREVEALTDFNEAIRLDPSDPLALGNRGNLHAKGGRAAEALADYNEAIRIDPTNPVLLANRGGLLLWQLERPEEAVRDLEEAEHLGYNTIDLHLNLAVLYRTLGRNADMERQLALAGECEQPENLDST